MNGERDSRPRRGRPPREEPAFPTGYRATDAIRRHLDQTAAFLNLRSHQEVINAAVQWYFQHLRDEDPDYAAASEALDRKIAAGQKNVTPLTSHPRTGRGTPRNPSTGDARN